MARTRLLAKQRHFRRLKALPMVITTSPIESDFFEVCYTLYILSRLLLIVSALMIRLCIVYTCRLCTVSGKQQLSIDNVRSKNSKLERILSTLRAAVLEYIGERTTKFR